MSVPPAPVGLFGAPMLFRRGPFTGNAFQPTADVRFRKAERLRADFPLAAACDSPAARLLDRKGQLLAVPVTTSLREQAGARFAGAEVTLAPLAQGDYLLEVTARRGDAVEKTLIAFRVVP